MTTPFVLELKSPGTLNVDSKHLRRAVIFDFLYLF